MTEEHMPDCAALFELPWTDHTCDCKLGKLRAEVERLVGLQKEIEIEKRGMAYDIHKLREAAKLLSTDMHYASMRPCRSCKAMTDALGEPYGCYAYQNRRKALEEQLGDD